MTVTYGFYDSLGGDRLYNAEQMSRLLEGVVTFGIFQSVGGALAVSTNSGMTIKVAAGRAWYDYTWTNNDANLILTVDTAEVVLNRIDTVILEVNKDLGVRANDIKIVKGTPGSSPVAPTLTNAGTLHQYALADIYVGAGVTTINSGNITSRVGTVGGVAYVAGILSTLDVDTQSGWFSDTNVWSYSSKDEMTGIVSIPANMTTKLQKGDRIKFNQDQALTAYWNMDSNSNSQVGSFNGTDTAMSYTSGKFGNAATFNGTTSKVVLTDTASLKPTVELTLGLCFKTGATGAEKGLFQSYSVNTNIAGVLLRISATNVLEVVIGNNTGTTIGPNAGYFAGSTVVTDNVFHCVVLTVRSNYAQLYLDGKLEGAFYTVQPAYAGTNYVRIGCRNSSGSDFSFMNGQIDDVYLINGYAIDEQTIKEKYVANVAMGTSPMSLTKKGIVTNVGDYSGGNTLVTFWCGVDHALVNAAITLPAFSHAKSPLGFPMDPQKWTVLFTDVASRSQASPVQNTWYNLGTMTFWAPIGLWRVNTYMLAEAVAASSIVVSVFTTLSTISNNESDPKFTRKSQLTNTDVQDGHTIAEYLSLTTKKLFYINAKTNQISGTQLLIRGDLATTIVKLECAYL